MKVCSVPSSSIPFKNSMVDNRWIFTHCPLSDRQEGSKQTLLICVEWAFSLRVIYNWKKKNVSNGTWTWKRKSSHTAHGQWQTAYNMKSDRIIHCVTLFIKFKNSEFIKVAFWTKQLSVTGDPDKFYVLSHAISRNLSPVWGMAAATLQKLFEAFGLFKVDESNLSDTKMHHKMSLFRRRTWLLTGKDSNL